MSVSIKEDFSKDFTYKDLSRRDLRSLIFHLIYAIDCFDYTVSLESIIDNFNRSVGLDIPQDSEALQIAQGVVDQRDVLDNNIEPLLDNWRLERIGLCTKLVLRLSIWELKNTDTPARIVINEAIELAKCFSEKDAYRFVNGILDEACKTYRKDEVIELQESKEEVDKEPKEKKEK